MTKLPKSCPDWCTGRHPRRGPHLSERWLHNLDLEPESTEGPGYPELCQMQLAADAGVIGGTTPTIRVWHGSHQGFTVTPVEAREIATSLLRLAASADDRKARPCDFLSHWGIRGEAATN